MVTMSGNDGADSLNYQLITAANEADMNGSKLGFDITVEISGKSLEGLSKTLVDTHAPEVDAQESPKPST